MTKLYNINIQGERSKAMRKLMMGIDIGTQSIHDCLIFLRKSIKISSISMPKSMDLGDFSIVKLHNAIFSLIRRNFPIMLKFQYRKEVV